LQATYIQGVMPDAWRHGISLFNSTHYFEAHEAFEEVWRDAPHGTHLRRHLQGIVQLAVAFHHHSTGNAAGARSVLERGWRNLDGAEESFPELDLGRLRIALNSWRYYLQRDFGGEGPSPELPQILFRSQSE
jgi:predicted metal-dependent hydrolase